MLTVGNKIDFDVLVDATDKDTIKWCDITTWIDVDLKFRFYFNFRGYFLEFLYPMMKYDENNNLNTITLSGGNDEPKRSYIKTFKHNDIIIINDMIRVEHVIDDRLFESIVRNLERQQEKFNKFLKEQIEDK